MNKLLTLSIIFMFSGSTPKALGQTQRQKTPNPENTSHNAQVQEKLQKLIDNNQNKVFGPIEKQLGFNLSKELERRIRDQFQVLSKEGCQEKIPTRSATVTKTRQPNTKRPTNQKQVHKT